jgi:hypothetical protein
MFIVMDFEKIYNDSVSNIFILPWHIAIICKRKTEKKTKQTKHIYGRSSIHSTQNLKSKSDYLWQVKLIRLIFIKLSTSGSKN